MTDCKQLCAELVEQLDDALDFTVSSETRRHMKLLTRKARAALAEPEPEGPTDEEIEEWADASAEVPLEALDPDVGGWQRCFNSTEFCQMVRAVLARWGRPAPVPAAEGEVGEFADALRDRAARLRATGFAMTAGEIERAADLLEQRHPAPVPLSERLPDNRDPECVANWPECWSGGYDPRCCRFPKSCSCERSALPPPIPTIRSTCKPY